MISTSTMVRAILDLMKPHQKALMMHLALAGMALVLSGCIAVPTPVPSKFRDSKIDFIEPGKTTRTEIEDQLSIKPAAGERLDGELVFYLSERPVVVVVGGTGSGSGGAFTTGDLLVREFDDNDVVQRAEAIKGGNNCTSDGRCFRSHREGFVVLGTETEDAAARRHIPPEGRCAVFAYTTSAPGCPITQFSMWQGERPVAWSITTRKGYLFWSPTIVDSESLVLHARTIAGFKHKRPAHINVDCESGQTYIYEAKRSCNPYLTLWEVPAKVTLRLVEPEEGQAALDKRTVVLQ